MIRTIGAYTYLFLYGIYSLFLQAYIYWFVQKKDPMKASVMSQKDVSRAFRVILFISGVKVEIKGKNNIPKNEPVLYVANHRSFYDIAIGYSYLPIPLGFVAKKEMAKVPFISRWMRYMHCVFLDRQNPREGLKSIMEGVENIKAGYSMFIMPEGTRNHEPKLKPFKKGSFKMAEKAKCRIVPIALTNTDEIFENSFPIIKPAKIIMEIGKPIDLAKLSKEEKETINEDVASMIQDMIDKNLKEA